MTRTAIFKNRILAKNKGEFAEKRKGTVLGYVDDMIRAIKRNFSDSSMGD